MRQKEIIVQPQQGVVFVHCIGGGLPFIAGVAYVSADYVPIFLLYMAVVVLFVRATASEFYFIFLAVIVQVVIYKFASVIRINALVPSRLMSLS